MEMEVWGREQDMVSGGPTPAGSTRGGARAPAGGEVWLWRFRLIAELAVEGSELKTRAREQLLALER